MCDTHRGTTPRAQFIRLADRLLDPAPNSSLAPPTRITKLFVWWASDGDTAAITTYINGFTASHVRAPTPLMAAMYRANISAGAAFLALARRDTLAAVRRLIAPRDTLHECWYENRVVLVQLLAATGRYREAGERLARRWPGTTQCSNGVDDVVWTMERAANTRAARDGRFRRKSACQG